MKNKIRLAIQNEKKVIYFDLYEHLLIENYKRSEMLYLFQIGSEKV